MLANSSDLPSRPIGTAIFFETNVVHRGSRPAAGRSRDVLMLELFHERGRKKDAYLYPRPLSKPELRRISTEFVDGLPVPAPRGGQS